MRLVVFLTFVEKGLKFQATSDSFNHHQSVFGVLDTVLDIASWIQFKASGAIVCNQLHNHVEIISNAK